MKTLACLPLMAVLAGGCTADEIEDEDPIIPQGGRSGVSVPGAATRLNARVCRVLDLRNLSTCSSVNNDDLTITLGNSATTTQPDGSFTIDVPAGITNTSNVSFSVTGPGVVPTTFPFTPRFNGTVPIVDQELFQRILELQGVPQLATGTGSILATVSRANQALSGVSVSSTPASAFGPFFDDLSTIGFGNAQVTGVRGAVLLPGLSAGMVDLSFMHIAGGLTSTVGGVQVRNGGVTILDLGFPDPSP
ncbi:MAG: hypothetical protein JWP01_1069 [Myxococcales bacterium]|nr:hypothetical protein [Myxococcales bacterium]